VFGSISVPFNGHELFDITVEQIVDINDILADEGNIENVLGRMDKRKNTLILTSNTDFVAFNFALYLAQGNTYATPVIIFIQSTMLTASDRNDKYKDIDNLRVKLDKNNKKIGVGVGVRVLDSLFPESKHHSEVSDDILSFFNSHGETLQVHYVYASGVAETMQDRNLSVSFKLPDNVVILSREYLETEWKVQF